MSLNRRVYLIVIVAVFLLTILGIVFFPSQQDPQYNFTNDSTVQSTSTGNSTQKYWQIRTLSFYNQSGKLTQIEQIWIDENKTDLIDPTYVELDGIDFINKVKIEKQNISYNYSNLTGGSDLILVVPDPVDSKIQFKNFPSRTVLKTSITWESDKPFNNQNTNYPVIPHHQFTLTTGDEDIQQSLVIASGLVTATVEWDEEGKLQSRTQKIAVNEHNQLLIIDYGETSSININIDELTSSNTLKPYQDSLTIQHPFQQQKIALQVENGNVVVGDLRHSQFTVTTDKHHILFSKDSSKLTISHAGTSSTLSFSTNFKEFAMLSMPLTPIQVTNQSNRTIGVILDFIRSQYKDTISSYNNRLNNPLPSHVLNNYFILEPHTSSEIVYLLPGEYTYEISTVEYLPEFFPNGNQKRNHTMVLREQMTLPYTSELQKFSFNPQQFGSISGEVDSDMMDGHEVFLYQYDNFQQKDYKIELSTYIQSNKFDFDFLKAGEYIVSIHLGNGKLHSSDKVVVKSQQVSHVQFNGYQLDKQDVAFTIKDRFQNPIRNQFVLIKQQNITRRYESDDEGLVRANILTDYPGELEIILKRKEGYIASNLVTLKHDSQSLNQTTLTFNNIGKFSILVHEQNQIAEGVPIMLRIEFNKAFSYYSFKSTITPFDIEAFPLENIEIYKFDESPNLFLDVITVAENKVIHLSLPEKTKEMVFIDQNRQPIPMVFVISPEEKYSFISDSFQNHFYRNKKHLMSNSSGKVTLYSNYSESLVYFHHKYGFGELDLTKEHINEELIYKYLEEPSYLNITKSKETKFTYFVLHSIKNHIFLLNVKQDLEFPYQSGTFDYKIIHSDKSFNDLVQSDEFVTTFGIETDIQYSTISN